MPHNKKIGPEQPGYYAASKSGGGDPRHPQVDGGGGNLEDLTKEQLLERATALGVSPANAGMSKAELVAAIGQAQQ